MIVGIPNMQVHGDSRPSHNPASEGSLETDPSTMTGYAAESPPVLVSQMHHHHPSAFVGLPPQQVYVGQNGGHHHHHYPPATDVGALASQFQTLSMPPPQQAPPPHRGAEAPQSGDSETGDDNDGTTETEEDPVKLFVGQVSQMGRFGRFLMVIGTTGLHLQVKLSLLEFRILYANHD